MKELLKNHELLTKLEIPNGCKEVYCSGNQLRELILPNSLEELWCDHSVKLINVEDQMRIKICYTTKIWKS